MTSANRMVADVGGTNTRIGLWDAELRKIRAVHSFLNHRYDNFEGVVQDWLEQLPERPPTTGCIAVAAPPAIDQVTMTNISWTFSCAALAHQFGFRQFGWVNDFESIAYALPQLDASERQLLYPGDAGASNRGRTKLAALGPGTGLGGATIEIANGTASVCACEPGHMGLSPANAWELDLFRELLQYHGNIYAELLVSGPGLQRLYETLAKQRKVDVTVRTPVQISEQALRGTDALCTEALNAFCALLGSASGDFALASGSYDGLYLAGGIVPGITEFLRQSDFRLRFTEKGAMKEHLARIPIYAITHANPGLLGAAHAPLG